ncbi:hypothetical protein [Labilibaculum euxinus]
MKQLEMRIYSNVNLTLLAEIVQNLKDIGCDIIEKEDKLVIEFKEELEDEVSIFFKNIKL